VNKERVYIIE